MQGDAKQPTLVDAKTTFNHTRFNKFKVFREEQSFNAKTAERVYKHIVKKIFNMEFNQADKILESEIAKDLNISIIPVREAMLQLYHEGWIVRHPNRRTTVADYQSWEKLRNLYQIRENIEIGNFYSLAKNITDEQLNSLKEIVLQIEAAHNANDPVGYSEFDAEFHRCVARYAGGNKMLEIFEPVFLQCVCFGALRLIRCDLASHIYEDIQKYDVEGRLPEASHRSLCEALAAHDSVLAAKLISEHVGTARALDLSKGNGT